MVLIDHAMGSFNYIFGGDGKGGWWVRVGCHSKVHVILHGWMSHGGQERGPHNDRQQHQDRFTHLWMRRHGGLFVSPGLSVSVIAFVEG